ncbi:hypothetical protein OS493_004579 [Desmophyllum pertusum]|uniref:Ig-like domain-containing protein n=1 Tax=Desmophyllum pertusum TaxID=174260 RepID=A0A9X0CZ75_9CNID|nr:hypothetical protein OS493_004579 [Desmophyllum pertusum]
MAYFVIFSAASSSIGDAASSMCTCPCGSSTMGSQSYLSSFVSSSNASITSNVSPASLSSSSFVSSSTDASTTSNVPPASLSSSSFVSSSTDASTTSNVPPATLSSSSFVSSMTDASTTSNVPTSLSSRICYCPCSTAAPTCRCRVHLCSHKHERRRRQCYCQHHSVVDAPSVDINPTAATVIEGNNITLTCNASGKPAPVITWKKAGESVLLSRNSSVTIVNVSRPGTPDNMIRYQCTASNGVGTNATATVNVTVHYLPTALAITPTPVNTTVLLGATVVLTCKTDANPAAHLYHFYFDGNHIGNSSSGVFNATVDKDGVYTCVPINTVGTGINATVRMTAVAVPASQSATSSPSQSMSLTSRESAIVGATVSSQSDNISTSVLQSQSPSVPLASEDVLLTTRPLQSASPSVSQKVSASMTVPASQSATPSPSQSMSLTSRESAIVGATVSGQSDNISTSVLQSQSPSVPLVSEDVSTRPLQSASPSVSQKVSASMSES